ncbi:DNA polymerase III subunit delta [Pseudomonadota bacterium]
MKIQTYQSDNFIKNIHIQNNLRGILLYGPDLGLVSLRSKEIQTSLSKNNKNTYLVSKVYHSETKENPSIVFDEFISISMFGDKKIIILKDFPDSIYKTLESLENKESDHFLIIEAERLDTKSKLRQFVEKSGFFASIPCYIDDEKSIKRIIIQKFAELGFKYDKEVLDLLSSNFGGNRMIVMNEIEKLTIFAGNDKYITVNHFKECIQDVSEAQIDDLINSFTNLNIEKVHIALIKLFNENVNFTIILRSLINYFTKLQLVKSLLVLSKKSYEEAVKELRPPLFFKQAPLFAEHINIWELKNINLFLDRLNLVETKCKSLKINTNLIVSDFLNNSIIYFKKANKN